MGCRHGANRSILGMGSTTLLVANLLHFKRSGPLFPLRQNLVGFATIRGISTLHYSIRQHCTSPYHAVSPHNSTLQIPQMRAVTLAWSFFSASRKACLRAASTLWAALTSER